MRYLLLQKNFPVALLQMQEETGYILSVDEVYDAERMPLGTIMPDGQVNFHAMTHWWKKRSIPMSRSGIAQALRVLQLETPQELLTKCLGLSLSDQYWIRPESIRSKLANDIFHDELQSLYQEQTVRRDELKLESKRQVENIVDGLRNGSFQNPELELLVQRLHEQLQDVSGKKVYGYLPKSVKETVNAIFAEIARNPSIDFLYEKWCELEQQKYKTYTQKEKDFPPLTENKVFHSIRNEIVRQVLNADTDVQHDHSVENLLPRDNSVHLSNTAFGLITSVANCIRDDYNQRFHSNRAIVDRKLRRLIREKKQAQGLQYEPEQSQEY